MVIIGRQGAGGRNALKDARDTAAAAVVQGQGALSIGRDTEFSRADRFPEAESASRCARTAPEERPCLRRSPADRAMSRRTGAHGSRRGAVSDRTAAQP